MRVALVLALAAIALTSAAAAAAADEGEGETDRLSEADFFEEDARHVYLWGPSKFAASRSLHQPACTRATPPQPERRPPPFSRRRPRIAVLR
jgi:hypothetical protein